MSETGPSDDGVQLRRLTVLGLLSCGGYVAIAVFSRQFALTVPSAERPHVAVVSLFAGLFGVYLVAVRVATGLTDARRTLTTTIAFAVVFRLVLLFTTPIQEIDLYRYVWDGNVVVSGVNPYCFSPKDVIQAGDSETVAGAHRDASGQILMAETPLQRLVNVERRSRALGQILRTVHFAELPTLYPPVSQAVFALAALTTPEAAAVHTHLIVMKAWLVLFDLLTMAAMIALLGAVRKPVGWCLAYAWCPLVLKEFANSGHLDAIAVCLTTAALWCLMSPGWRQQERCGWPDASERRATFWQILAPAVLLGLGIGAKLFPVVLLPVCCGWAVKRRGWRSAFAFVAGVVVIAGVTLAPMLAGEHSREIVVASPEEPARLPPLPTDLDAQSPITGGHQPLSTADTLPAADAEMRSGLAAFLTRWQMNDFLFLIVSENLDPSRPELREPWFAAVPDGVRMKLVSPLMAMFDVDSAAAAFLLARGLTLATFGAIACWLLWSLSSAQESTPAALSSRGADGSSARFLRACFLTLAWFWLLAPTQNPWYWSWCLPLVPFARSRAWVWVSGLVVVYYLRFWAAAHWPEPPGPLGSRYDGASFFDFVLVWFEYVPLFAGLLVGWILNLRIDKK